MKLMALLCMLPGLALAAPSWEISPRSTITFTATQNGAPVSGKFTSFGGKIEFSPQDLATSNINLAIDTNSIKTSFAPIADELKGKNWFNSKAFPQATFTSTKISKKEGNNYQAEGELSIRDKKSPATVTFHIDEFTEQKARASGKMTIQRSAFGIGQGEWASTNEIKDDVLVSFNLILIP